MTDVPSEEEPGKALDKEFQKMGRILVMYSNDSKPCYPLKCSKIIPKQIGIEYRRKFHDLNAAEQDDDYLVDENDNAGKGADAVIPMLHDYFETNDLSNGGILILFTHNCVGQNKNNAVIQYLDWLVLTGKIICIEHNFI